MIPTRSARLWLLILLASILAGCSDEPLFERRFLAFGTLIEVSIYDADPEIAEQAVEALRADFEYLHATWHPWEPGSLNRVNRLIETGAEFSLGPGFAERIREAGVLSRASGGLFNPAIGKLVALWGFDSDETGTRAPPPKAGIDALLAQHPRIADLEIRGIRMRSTNPGVWLDFGGYLKGYALDEAVGKLKEAGIKNAIVNAGGDLRAYGRHGDRPWIIGIRKPDGPGVLASVDIREDEAVVTSGDYERFFEHEGERYHHILDPRTGYPARGLRSATVIHPNAAVADAAATALFVAGVEDSIAIAQALGIDQAMLVDESGKVFLSPRMTERVEFVGEAPETVVLGR